MTLTTFEGMDPDGDLPKFMVADEDLTTIIDADDYAAAKMDAMRAHATQIAVDGPFFALSNNKGNEIWGTEFFRIAKGTPGPAGPDGPGDGPLRRARVTGGSSPLGAKVAGFTVLGLVLFGGAPLGRCLPLRRRRGAPQRQGRGRQHRRPVARRRRRRSCAPSWSRAPRTRSRSATATGAR